MQEKNKRIKHIMKKWEISLIELQTNGNKKYKVTRRIAYLQVNETKFFDTKEEAKNQIDFWLQ